MGSLLSLLATSVMESDTGSYIVAAAALPLGCYFVLQHALTLWHRPSTSLSGWNTVALGHGLAATICLLLASPLLHHLWLGDVQLSDDLVLEGRWVPAAAVASAVLLVFALQASVHAARTGCCAGPAAWPQTVALDDDEFEQLRAFVGRQCDSLAHKYRFGMALTKAWRVDNPAALAAWNEMEAAREAAGKGSAVAHLFHGTSEDSARAIVADGFRLPPKAGARSPPLAFRPPAHSVCLEVTGRRLHRALGRHVWQGPLLCRLPAQVAPVLVAAPRPRLLWLRAAVHAAVRRGAGHDQGQDDREQPPRPRPRPTAVAAAAGAAGAT